MDNRIDFFDLKRQYSQIKIEINKALEEVCETVEFSGGSFVSNFEENFAKFCKSKFAIGLNSGTSSLHLAMIVLKIRESDEVIVPANSFISTALAPSYVNATPVFADCTPDTWNIDPHDVRKKITKKTKAIIGVHLYGQPFDIDPIKEIARENNLYLIEDCAQSHGAKYKGLPVGGLTEMGCFSFYPGKNLGAYGEGGAIVTNNYNHCKRLKSLRNLGSSLKYYHDESGFNMRMDGFQGAVLNTKLRYLEKWNNRRKEIAKIYQGGISNPKIKWQFQPDWSDSAYHLFVITTDERDRFNNYLKMNNVFCGIHYPIPCHLQKVFKSLGYKSGDLPNSEYLADHCISLPMYPELTGPEVKRVISLINKY